MALPSVINRIVSGSLVLQIAVGIVAGIALSLISPEAGKASMLTRYPVPRPGLSVGRARPALLQDCN